MTKNRKLLSFLGNRSDTESKGFLIAFNILFLAVLIGILGQKLFDWSGQSGMGVWIWLIGNLVLFVGFILFFRKPLFYIIDTPYFAISSLLFIAVATALGTFVTQNATPEVFSLRYGVQGSHALRFFQLHDVFHSWWYVILYILMAVSLVKISLKRALNLANLGFHLAHLGPIIILFGFWWDFYAGFRGIMQLETGQQTTWVDLYNSTDSTQLDFQIRLDRFESEKFEPDHRIQLWEEKAIPPSKQKQDGPAEMQKKQRIIASLPVELNKVTKIYNSDITFELTEFYPNFYLKYSYPENIDTIEPRNPGIFFELTTPHGSDLIQLPSNEKGGQVFNAAVLGTSFEFYWELPEEIEQEISNHSGLKESPGVRIIFAGKQNMLYELTNEELTSKSLKSEEFYAIPGKGSSGYSILQVFPDVAHLTSSPATRNDLQENPVAKLTLNSPEWKEAKPAFLYPSKSGPGGQFAIPGTNYILALESIKDKETKYWKSDLSVLDGTETVLKEKSIKVNEPLNYKGYRFYQTDYDPNNPRYSGIGVSHMPGLYLIYFGFYVLVAGVFMLFYTRLRNRKLEEEGKDQ